MKVNSNEGEITVYSKSQVDEVIAPLSSSLDNMQNQINKPVAIRNIDNFDDNNFIAANSLVDSTSTVLNNQLSIVSGAGSYKTSSLIHRLFGQGNNCIINTVIVGNTPLPQIHIKVPNLPLANRYLCFISAGLPKIRRTLNAIDTDLLTGSLDGNITNDMELSVRTFNEMIDFFIMQNGYVISALRHIDRDLLMTTYLNNINNGLGANGTTVYKNYKADTLSEYKNIVCVGDSNTLGLHLTTKQAYPNQLQAMFFDKNVGVVNKGVSGDRITNIAARLNDIYNNNILDADNIVVLQAGTNNATDGTPAATIYADMMNTVITPLKNNGFRVIVCTVPPRGDDVNANVIVKELNTIIRLNTVPVDLVDFYTQLVDNSDVFMSRMFYTDSKHLSEIGCMVIANLIRQKLYT